jgi:hypothetical protein
MPNQELLSYIKKQLEKNISKDIIRQALLKAGWSIVDIESSFLELDKRSTSSNQIAPSQAPKTELNPAQKELQEMIKANPDYYHFERKTEVKTSVPASQPTQNQAKPLPSTQNNTPLNSVEAKQVEKVFNHGIAKAEPEKSFNSQLKSEPTVLKKSDLPRSTSAVKGIMLGILAFVISAISAYVYIYWQDVKDPMFLIPSNNDAVVVFNMDTKTPQWTKTRQLISRIPFGEKMLEEMASKGLLSGAVKQVISFMNIDTNKIGALIEFSGEVDDKTIQSLKDILNVGLSTTEETEKYQGIEIKKVSRDLSALYSSLLEPGLEQPTDSKMFLLAYAQLGNKIAVSNDIDQIKLVVANYKRANITSIFSKGLAKGIKDTPAFKKLKQYIPKEYLMWGYANIDLKNIDPTTLGKNLNGFYYQQALFAALNQAKTPTASGVLFYTLASDSGIVSKQYATGDLTSVMEDFDVSNSLGKDVNLEIGDKKLFLYSEVKNLAKYFKEAQKMQGTTQSQQLVSAFEMLKQETGIDAQQLINYMDGQTAVSAYLGEAKENATAIPLLVNIKIQSSKASEIDNLLSSIQIKDVLKEAIMKANDARIISEISQMRSQAELYNSEKGFYPYYLGSSAEIKKLTDDIKERTSDKSIVVFNSSGAKYCAYAKINADDSYYCIDSAGVSGSFNATNVNVTCKKGIYTCPTSDKQKQNTYTVQSKGFADLGIGSIKTLPIMGENILLGYSINGDIIDLFIGSQSDIESFANANSIKINETQEYKDTIGSNKNIKSIVYLKPGALVEFFPATLLQVSQETKNSIAEIFPLISGVSYLQKDIMINDSQIQIKDLGQSKIKSIEDAITNAQNDLYSQFSLPSGDDFSTSTLISSSTPEINIDQNQDLETNISY